MNFKKLAAALLFAGIAGTAFGADAGAAVVTVPGKAMVAGQVTYTGEVTAVDATTRVVTVKNAKGESYEIVAGPEVKNFAQIKVGDALVIKAVQALTLELKKGGAGIRERTDAVDGVRAAEGEKPGAAAGAKTTVIADVVAVDRKTGVVTLKGVHHSMKLNVKDPEQLKLIEKGDQVKGTYVEAIGVAVMPAAKPAAK
ncbi:hypothetical protein GCM10025771_31050 [Niveibacterium umoris]|uniref:Cu/Ag efflux protein CusF n=1 Tax=Niveibacterium umoris TaxID=1193620 RepID=A0A840BJC7_9RHOO|nr:hypothetical protein [Niveibacterium umoris]MBB4011702.1 Cu/Ag efflux protein CusF [Niveibacterium umoris]